MPPLLPRSLHRLALRVAHRLRHVWRRLAKPQLRGVSVILRDPEGRVLFVRHTYGPPDWSLPGGGIARGEAPEAAARREMAEELALTLGPVSELLRIYICIPKFRKIFCIFIVYYFYE